MPWNSSIRFGGLAYCLGGRSLYFGGWSPRYLRTEMDCRAKVNGTFVHYHFQILSNSQDSVTVPVGPGQDLDEAQVPRATATIVPRVVPGNDLESQVMNLMNQGIDFLAQNLFGVVPGPKYNPAANINPDGLGTTFHGSGTLRMGDEPLRSVVNPDCQFYFVTNLYAGDAAVLPTCESANPVMNGVAVRRRLARRLVPEGDAGANLRSLISARQIPV